MHDIICSMLQSNRTINIVDFQHQEEHYVMSHKCIK
jgi:hypothetical protein